MVFTNSDYLPSPAELDVKEIPLTIMPFKAAARSVASYCDQQYKEFMLCRDETKDIRKCVQLGKEVTTCGNEFLHKVKTHCDVEFTNYWRCLYKHPSSQFCYITCKKKQLEFNACVADKIQQEVHPIGYFSKIRLVDSKHPRREVKDALGDLHGVQPTFRVGREPTEEDKAKGNWSNRNPAFAH